MTMGFIKSIWFFEEPQALFADMMERMKPFTFLFILSGMSLFLSFLGVISGLVYTLFKKHS